MKPANNNKESDNLMNSLQRLLKEVEAKKPSQKATESHISKIAFADSDFIAVHNIIPSRAAAAVSTQGATSCASK